MCTRQRSTLGFLKPSWLESTPPHTHTHQETGEMSSYLRVWPRGNFVVVMELGSVDPDVGCWGYSYTDGNAMS